MAVKADYYYCLSLILHFSCFSGRGGELTFTRPYFSTTRCKNQFFHAWVPKAPPKPLCCFLSRDGRFPFIFFLKSSREEESRENQVSLGHDSEICFPGQLRLSSTSVTYSSPHSPSQQQSDNAADII